MSQIAGCCGDTQCLIRQSVCGFTVATCCEYRRLGETGLDNPDDQFLRYIELGDLIEVRTKAARAAAVDAARRRVKELAALRRERRAAGADRMPAPAAMQAGRRAASLVPAGGVTAREEA